MQGNAEHVLSLYGGKETDMRCFFGEGLGMLGSRVGGAGPEYRFGPESAENLYSPRAPRNAEEYRTCGGDGSVHGAVPSGSLQRFGSVHGGSVSAVRFGSVRFQNLSDYSTSV